MSPHSSALPRYRPSGKTSLRFIPATLLGCCVGIGLAYPYQAVVSAVPFVAMNALIYLGTCLVVGGLVRTVAARGHNRSQWLGAIAGLAIATSFIGASHYFAYRSVYADAVDAAAAEGRRTEAEVEAVASEVITFSRYIEARVEAGWSLGRASASSERPGDFTGPFVWIVWAIEALGLVRAGVLAGIRGRPYCESCHASIPAQTLFVRSDLDLAGLGALSGARSAAALVDVPPRAGDAPITTRVTYVAHACPTCRGDAYLTVSRVLVAAAPNERDEEATLHTEVALAREHYDRLLALQRELQARASHAA